MLNWLKRYVSLPMLVVLGFVVYVLFFNENSVKKNIAYAVEIRDLKTQIAQYEDTLTLYQRLNSLLDGNNDEMERIVRENYQMQRPSEDVYIFD